MQKLRVSVSSFQYGEVSDSLIMRTDSPIYAQSAQKLENMLVMSEGSAKKRPGLKHIYDYSLSSNSKVQSHLFRFIFDENEEYVISVEEGKVRCFRLLADGSVSLVDTITQDTDSNALPFDDDYLQEYTTAQYGDVMFISHPLFAPRMLTRTSLTDFEVSVFTFDSQLDGKKTYQPYTKFQASNVFFDPSSTSGTSIACQLFTNTGTSDPDGIAVTQNEFLSPFDFDLNGALASGGTVTLDVAAQITITSTSSNHHTQQTFTITGTDQDGESVTETFSGPAANDTVATSRNIKTITSISSTNSFRNLSVGVSKRQSVSYFDITGSKVNGAYPNSAHLGVTLRYGEAEMIIVEVISSDRVKVDVVDQLKRRLEVLNPLRTTDGSNEVQVTMIGHGFAGGEAIIIYDAAPTGGINSSKINGSRTVTEIIDENTFTYTAGGTANESEDGGGFVSIESHAPTVDWNEQSWSSARGYPASVTFHENRLIFGGTISEPDSIWMSKIGNFFNFDVGEAADADSIALVAATGDVNEIRYMISNRDLQIFTASSELYIPTFLNQAITPTNAQIRKQTPYGIAHVMPVPIDGATIFAANNGRVVREYLFTDSEDAYTANAISTLASHLINDPIFMTVAHSAFSLPDSYAMMVMSNGDAALFTSNRAERRAAWTSLTTDGSFASVIAVEDRIFANVYDTDGNLHLCEFSEDVGLDFWVYGAVSANVLDVSAKYSSGDAVDVIGINNGAQSYLGSFTVNGSNEVDLSAHTGYAHAYAGNKFTAKIVTNPVDAAVSAGAITGEVRGVSSVIVDAKSVESMKVNNRPLTGTLPFDGKKEFRLLGYSRDPQVTIEQDDPLGLQVNGMIAELVV